MPSPFDITTVSNTVTLDNNRAGVASFTVKNNTRRRIHATARLTLNLADDKQPISTLPADAPKWLTIAPPASGGTGSAEARDFPIDGTQSYQVNIAVPMTAPAASYKFKLTVADDNNPDDNFATSPDVLFTVVDIPKPPPRPFPMWIIPAIIIVVLVIAAIIVISVVTTNNQHVHETETAVEITRETADAGTSIAQQTIAAQTAIAQQTAVVQTAIAQQTQTAFNAWLGSWKLENASSLTVISDFQIEDAGNLRVNLFLNICTSPLLLCVSGPFINEELGGLFVSGRQISFNTGSGNILFQLAAPDQIIVTGNQSGFSFQEQFVRTLAAQEARPAPTLIATSEVLSDQEIATLVQIASETLTATPTATATP